MSAWRLILADLAWRLFSAERLTMGLGTECEARDKSVIGGTRSSAYFVCNRAVIGGKGWSPRKPDTNHQAVQPHWR